MEVVNKCLKNNNNNMVQHPALVSESVCPFSTFTAHFPVCVEVLDVFLNQYPFFFLRLGLLLSL